MANGCPNITFGQIKVELGQLRQTYPSGHCNTELGQASYPVPYRGKTNPWKGRVERLHQKIEESGRAEYAIFVCFSELISHSFSSRSE